MTDHHLERGHDLDPVLAAVCQMLDVNPDTTTAMRLEWDGTTQLDGTMLLTVEWDSRTTLTPDQEREVLTLIANRHHPRDDRP